MNNCQWYVSTDFVTDCLKAVIKGIPVLDYDWLNYVPHIEMNQSDSKYFYIVAKKNLFQVNALLLNSLFMNHISYISNKKCFFSTISAYLNDL